MTTSLAESIRRIAGRESLSREEARALMDEVLAGRATDAEITALLVALHMKGESVEEIVGFAEAMRAAATPLRLTAGADDVLVDTCGTGGDALGTFNISTTAAFVVAGAGVRVAKHGNRSVTSKSGSADVLEALGVRLELPPDRLAACLNQVGIAFLYAPALHSAMKHVQAARRTLRQRTVFNLLGPLTNPAGATAQVVGVYSEELVEKVAEALRLLGLKRALVVHGRDGLDEITISGPTRIAELRNGRLRTYSLTPEECGLRRMPLDTISGGDVPANAAILRAVLEGEKSPRRDVVLMNAAAALVAAGKAESVPEGVPLAAKSLDSGAAGAKLAAFVRFTGQS
jgi:anthranilate phosphoribosyltransferase